MSKLNKQKTVSNLAMQICTILDFIEVDQLDINKLVAYGPKMDKFMYDIDRQVKKKSQDEFYKLDINSADLQAIAIAAEKHVNKLRPKCTYRSMRKALELMAVDNVIAPDVYRKWCKSTTDLFYVCGLLHRLQCVMSYQATLFDLLEADEEANKIENVLMNALKDVIKKGPNVW